MNNNITIYESDIEDVQELCKSISEPDIRSRAVANALGVNAAAKLFENEDFDCDYESGLYSIPEVAEKLDIADLYIKNTYVDVRIFFNEKEMGIPKSHFDKDVLPSAYMFLKLSENLSDAEVLGFIIPENVNTDNNINGYYPVKEDELVSFYDIEGRLNSPLDLDNVEDADFYKYIDGDLDDENSLYKDLIKSKRARTKLKNVLTAQSALKHAVIPDGTEEKSEEDFGIDIVPSPVPEVIDSAVEVPQYEEVLPEVSDEEPIVQKQVEEQEVIAQEEFAAEENITGKAISAEDFAKQLSDKDSVHTEDKETAEDDLEVLFDSEENKTDNNFSTEVTASGAEIIESLDKEENSNEEIQTLFEETDNVAQGVSSGKKSSGAARFFLLLILMAAIGGGYWWYTNNGDKLPPPEENLYQGPAVDEVMPEQTQNSEDAMPVETVEKVENLNKTEEGNSVSIPAIEQNLDASILVSNLKVDWEVPEGFASNTAAKRYFVKVGKVVQLNLKTELLLLNKPPISNVVIVQLKYDDAKRKFEVVGITKSSGEKSVDDAILDTVNSALGMSLSTNTDSFGKIQGNPALIIHF